jgi:hypothetical protein
MRIARFTLIWLGLFLCWSVAPAQITQQKDGYLIFVKYKKGQTITQDMSMNAVGNTKLKSTSRFMTKCLDVDKNGNSTIEVTVAGNGKAKATKKKLKVDNHGKPIGNSIDGYSGSFAWPDKPVRVGDSWIGNITMASAGQGAGGSIKSTYKFAGIKTVKGVRVASIAAVLNVGGSFEISGTGMIYVRFSDGQLENADFNLALKQFSESNTQAKLKLVMTIRNVK